MVDLKWKIECFFKRRKYKKLIKKTDEQLVSLSWFFGVEKQYSKEASDMYYKLQEDQKVYKMILKQLY